MMVADTTSATAVLELQGICKSFAGVRALHHAGLRLFAGEVHTLMGQNGAGKSTLIKVLTGVYTPDHGNILLDGKAIQARSTMDAQNLGISTVYQEVNLSPNLSVAENIFIGRYPKRFGLIAWRVMQKQAQQVLKEIGLEIDVKQKLENYPLAIQQMVAIARALNISAKVLILDEPTSSLDEHEVQQLFSVLRRLREQGMAILFVTHFLEQTYAISDRITVMRDGEREGEYLTGDLPRLELINRMLGVPNPQQLTDQGNVPVNTVAELIPATDKEILLETHALGRRGALQAVDLSIRRGEVVGLCGLLGSGRTELARLLFGADIADSGSMQIQSVQHRFFKPQHAIRQGIAFCSEDRKHEGALLTLSVRENMMLALQVQRGLLHAISDSEQAQVVQTYIDKLGIKTENMETAIGSLSGGNQQKVLLARWLITNPKLLILDEPTRGIDISAKQEIMDYVRSLCQQGLSILFISSELAEVLQYSDKIVVMRERKTCGEYQKTDLDETTVLRLIAGEAA
ncbi:sugar ABC transporter ATP-binding protein [Undibacterium sp. Ji22W]|uniref:sugar ABC transporter ATP-binding protein n=1 Tax=Undibacterium sp. Ji22W TaxID=3413038 RepID=UPI003BEF7FDF